MPQVGGQANSGNVIQATGGGRFKVLLPHGGEQHVVQGLSSAEEAGLVCDVLALKEAINGSVDEATLQLHRQPQLKVEAFKRCMAETGGSELGSMPSSQLVEQLQACTTFRLAKDQEIANWFTLLHVASELGYKPLAQLLLMAAPASATEAYLEGSLPLHFAALSGHTEVCQLLLKVAPATATAANEFGELPLHFAAQNGHIVACKLLLKASLTAASMGDAIGLLPLHQAAAGGHTAACELLLMDAPATVTAVDGEGWLPLHWAAQEGHTAVCQLLVKAAPVTAMEKNNEGALALHLAAVKGHPATTLGLLEAAPTAALVADIYGMIPLQLALGFGQQAPHLNAARCLLAAGPANTILPLLSAAGPPALPLFADFVIARPPLSGEDWALVPVSCPGLGRALPAALPHSPEQARQLVLHLPPPDVQRLRTSALALHRAHKRWRCSLPMAVVWRILALGNDPEPHPDDPGAQSPPTNLSSFLLSLFCSLVHPVAVLYRHLTG